MTPENLVQKILQIEKQYKLFDMSIENIHFYQLLRMKIYYFIIGQKKVYNQQNYNYKNKFLTIFFIIKEFFLFYRRKKNLKNKICIVRHSRNINGIDIYTNHLEKIIDQYTTLHITAGINFFINKKSINYDYILLKKKFLSFLNISYTNKNNQVKKLIKIFKNNFSLGANFEKFVYSQIQNQINSYLEAKKFLKKSNFEKMIIVNSYGNMGLVYAANELNIETIELQHGGINNYHLGYHFPEIKKNSLKAFPKKLILFGDFWKTKANFPIIKKNIISLGFPYFDQNKSNIIKTDHTYQNRILILSQQSTQNLIIEFLKQIISKQKDLFFTYKAHPKEDIDFLKKVVLENDLKNNIQIITGNYSIYSLFKSHSSQIGVFSTALYEGYSCNLKTGIIHIPGWENMKSILTYPNVYLLRNHIDLINNE